MAARTSRSPRSAAAPRERARKADRASRHVVLTAALRALDDVLGIAVEQQARRLGPQSLLDPWRGMHLELADVQRLLGHAEAPPGATGVAGLLDVAMATLPLPAALGDAWAALDRAVWLLIAAAELDLRYERIYGYLQDDLTRRRPTADLIANLLATSPEERLRVLARLAPDAPLRRHGVIETSGDAAQPWLAQPWQLDSLWRDWLLERAAPEWPASSGARVVDAQDDLLALPEAGSKAFAAMQPILERGQVPRLLLRGPHGAGKLRLAGTVAAQRRQRLLVADVRGWLGASEARRQTQRVLRAAALFGLLPYLHGTGALVHADPQALRTLVETLAETPGAGFVVGSAGAWPPLHAAALDALRLDLGFPAPGQRALIWKRALHERGFAAVPQALAEAGARFVLGAAQIEQAVADVQPPSSTAARGRAWTLDYATLAAVARRQSGSELAAIAQRLTPQAGFDALVAVPDVHMQLREICQRVATREVVRRDWNRGSVHGRAQGVMALFVGPSGTGKTLSAEALAGELGLDLYRIDLAGIVSKYIGETEKNLDRVFTAAEHANAVLFFDEADALFGKRSEVKDAHDRYANIEVAYLLQKMEQFDGLAILATNLKQNLDEAFARRLTFTVSFPFPEEAERARLWEQLWPPGAPRAGDVELGWFAREYRLSGGNIRNTVMAAAHLAAADGQVVTHAHLLHATRREFQKLGKNIAVATGVTL